MSQSMICSARCGGVKVAVRGGVSLIALSLSACGAAADPAGASGSMVGGAGAEGFNGGSQEMGAAGTAMGSNEDLGLDVGGAGEITSMGGGPGFESCVGEARQAEGVGIDMYVVLDRSGSMQWEGASDNGPGDCPLGLGAAPGNASKWCLATHALAEYFTSEFAAHNKAALQYMPINGITYESGSAVCTTGGGIANAVVPLAQLPAAATDALITSLDGEDPGGGMGGGTPIEAALNGIATYTAANADPTRPMIGVLITDGDPRNCDEVPTSLAQVIAAHLQATTIRTFIIGMTGASNGNLETLALAGGAPPHTDFCGDGPSPCHYWNVGDGDPAAFVSALQQIQQSATLPCDFTIPVPPDGKDLDPGLVNLTFTNDVGVVSNVAHVNDELSCAGADGWYYDNNLAPTTVKLCPTTCTAAEGATQGANVDVSFGCATVLR